ncbi:MAG: RnfABCDGE type electron transport complex subunit D [Kiritimatiellae bacterium]|nr:RnfABCDGE type electron transport complex subunit D [Kiritimatiellia bacterium]
MLRVLYALAPLCVMSVYLFGWRVVAVLAVSNLAAFLTEWIMAAQRDGKVSYACFVTGSLFALSLTATLPLWVAVVGVVVGILFGKEVFGGFGKNVFNPAIVGRAFIFVCFPLEVTSRYVPVFRGFPGGFAHWSFDALKELPSYYAGHGLGVADGVTAATPLWAVRDYGYAASIWDLATGRIGGLFEYAGQARLLAAGSNAEVCGLLIILAGIYLLWTRTANYRLTVGMLAGAIGMNVLLKYILRLDGAPTVPFTLFSGALLYAAVFMVTDPVSAPKITPSQWIYGVFIGALVVFFRYKAVFTGGVTFAILLGNMLSPSLDLWIKRFRARSGEAAT